MKLFRCQNCSHVLYFENTSCERCGSRLGYLPEAATLSALRPGRDTADGVPLWKPMAAARSKRIFCANAAHLVCNWLAPAEGGDYCLACRHNRTIPPLDNPENLELWRKLEDAKHRLIYTLRALRLPLVTRAENPDHGLAFDFLADAPSPSGPRVMTGHDNGIITIALREADDAERERLRAQMHEPYRTLLGHFRHEVGHYYWDVLVRDEDRLDACRALFGDDTQDYGAALQRHYQDGPPADWRAGFISAYATMHPWEDWAETWAHYLHIVDTLETARAFNLRTAPAVVRDSSLRARIDFDPHDGGATVEQLIESWLPVSYALNALNRSIGHADVYPFVISQPVIEKLGFVHQVVHAPRTAPATAAPPPPDVMQTPVPEGSPAPQPEPAA